MTPVRGIWPTAVAGIALALNGCQVFLAAPAPGGNATIRGRAGNSDIAITTASRVAGAIHAVQWNGKEFIDSVDHGRQLQSALNLDGGISPMRVLEI